MEQRGYSVIERLPEAEPTDDERKAYSLGWRPGTVISAATFLRAHGIAPTLMTAIIGDKAELVNKDNSQDKS